MRLEERLSKTEKLLAEVLQRIEALEKMNNMSAIPPPPTSTNFSPQYPLPEQVGNYVEHEPTPLLPPSFTVTSSTSQPTSAITNNCLQYQAPESVDYSHSPKTSNNKHHLWATDHSQLSPTIATNNQYQKLASDYYAQPIPPITTDHHLLSAILNYNPCFKAWQYGFTKMVIHFP